MRYRRLALLIAIWAPGVLAVGVLASSEFGGGEAVLSPPVFVLHRMAEARFPGPPDQPVFVLVVGHDARPGEPRARGDALHLIGVNPATGQATILNIPRDTYINVPGRGIDKINTGYLDGGPKLQAQTVSEFVGVEIPWVISTGFEGFVGIVDELGGVDVNVPLKMADANSGAFFEAGVNHLDGSAALAFSRNRGIPDGDLRRTEHQGFLIVAALAKLRAEQPDMLKTFQWLAVLLRYGRFDGAGVADLYRLGKLALSIDPNNVRTVTMPGSPGRAGVQSVVFVGAGADELFADFRDDAILQSH